MSNIYSKLYNYDAKSDGKRLWTPPSFKDFVKDQFAKIQIPIFLAEADKDFSLVEELA